MAIKEVSIVGSISPTRLPSSRIKDEDDAKYLKMPMIYWSDILQSPSCFKNRQEMLLKTWAHVLRAYALSSVITFEVFRQQDSQHQQMNMDVSTTGYDIALCEFQELAACFGGEWNNQELSIDIRSKSQLPLLENLCNTSVSTTTNRPTMRRHLDFELTADCRDIPGGISLWIRASTVPVIFGEAVNATFQHVMSALAQNAVSKLMNSPLSEQDWTSLREFTRKPLFENRDCMHNLFKKSVAVSPTSEAICAWDGALSYQELNVISDTVAKVLVAKGVQVGDYVPFGFEKSMWAAVAVLAILKAGAAFVPLDPNQPLARLQGILADVNAKLVVVSESLERIFAPIAEEVVVVSDAIGKSNTPTIDEDASVLPDVEPHHTAFVLFTSGSTGKPKGMIMQHGAYSTHTVAHGRAMGYEKARVLQFAAHTFDVFVMDVFATLAFGGCICIPSESDRRFDVVQTFNDFRIDLAILTPSFAHVLEPAKLKHLRTLAVGGEALKDVTVRKWTADAAGVSLIQIYGPAEVGICILGNLSQSASAPETIGYPLDNSLCLLVDPDDSERLVPLGAVGELVVAGPTMLREYLNNPEKNKACFIHQPSWSKQLGLSQQRFYKSGDLLRYNIERMDGSFDFVGRKDSQVKYHGQRMELEDVEHHLSSIESVSACMACIPQLGSLKGRLVAIIQLGLPGQAGVKHGKAIELVQNAELTIGKMRSHLSERLPGYMIPNTLLIVRNVPFTASLKLDRPAMNQWVAQLDDTTVTREMLHKLSCDVLAPHEMTAQSLSREYARLVGGDNHRHRAALEGHDFCLQAGGIDSIQIISFSNFVQKVWETRVPMSLMLSSSVTIRSIAAVVDNKEKQAGISMRASATLKSEDEATMLMEKLLADIRVRPAPRVIQNVLLTGATGFLGIDILRQLLEKGLRVFALVKGRTVALARQRLSQQAEEAGWWREEFASRLEVWLGDLSQIDLGLDDACRQRILGTSARSTDAIHAIIHNGAKVHYSLDYSSVKNVNVLSTLELLKLTATASNVRSFVYVSGGQQLTFEEDDGSTDIPVEDGYARSKFVSEKIVQKCMLRPEFQNVNLSIVKPGYIIGAMDDGVPNPTDFLWRLIASCIEIGGYDVDDADKWLCVAAKSRVAQVVIEGAITEQFQPVTKILDGLRFIDLWQLLGQEFDLALQPLSHPEWLCQLRDAVIEKQDRHVMFPLIHMLERGESIGSLAGPSQATPGVMDAVRANIRHLIKVGYLRKSDSGVGNNRLKREQTPDTIEEVPVMT